LKRFIILLALPFLFPVTGAEIPSGAELQQQANITVLSAPGEMEAEIDPDTYIVGVGDQFLVEKMQDKVMYSLPVLPTGVISIPGVATIKIGGKTLSEALAIISKEAGPYSHVSLYDVKKIRIPVSGAVENPGIYSISAAWRLSDLLKKMPLSSRAKDFAVEIKSKEKNRVVNIYEFYMNGDLDHNPYLHAGESIYIPYADIETECVEIYGPAVYKNSYEYGPEDKTPAGYVDTLTDRGIRPFIPGETLQDFISRKILISDAGDYNSITVTRKGTQIFIPLSELDDFVLEARDKIEFVSMSNVMISGHVNRPGTYSFVPGHSLIDYISMAGGVNQKGSENSALIVREGKKIRHADAIQIQRGDIILVKRSTEDILIGETSVLNFISMIASIAATVITAFIAAGNP
jgi:protein involved in polysaccharide export with SLBB domain